MYKISRKKAEFNFKTKKQRKISNIKKQYGGSPDITIISTLSLLPFDNYGEFLNPIYGMLWNINLIPNYYKFMCSINITGKFVKNLFTSPIFNEIVASKTGVLGKLTPYDIGQIIAMYYIKKCETEKPYIGKTLVKKPKPLKPDAKQIPTDKNILNCSYVKPLDKLKPVLDDKSTRFDRNYKNINEKFAAFKRFIDISVTDIITNQYCFHILMAFMWAKSENITDIYQYLLGISDRLSELTKGEQQHYRFDVIISTVSQIVPSTVSQIVPSQNTAALNTTARNPTKLSGKGLHPINSGSIVGSNHKGGSLRKFNLQFGSSSSSSMSSSNSSSDSIGLAAVTATSHDSAVAGSRKIISPNISIITQIIRILHQILGELNLIAFSESILASELGNFTFTDCTETVIRNVVNILLFYKIIDINALNPDFREYYTIYGGYDKQSVNITQHFKGGLLNARNGWAKLVCGIPGINYNEGMPRNGYNMEGDEHNLYQMLAIILNIYKTDIKSDKQDNKTKVVKFLKDRHVLLEDKHVEKQHIIFIKLHGKILFQIRIIDGHAYIEHYQQDKQSVGVKDADELLFKKIARYETLHNILSGITNRPIAHNQHRRPNDIPELFYAKITPEIATEYCNNLVNYNNAFASMELKLIYMNMFWFVLQTYDHINRYPTSTILWITDLVNNIDLSYIPATTLANLGIILDDKGHVFEVSAYYKPTALKAKKTQISSDIFKTKLPNVKSLVLDSEIIGWNTFPDTLENITINTLILQQADVDKLPHSLTRMSLLGNSGFVIGVKIPDNLRVLIFENYTNSINFSARLQKLVIVHLIGITVDLPENLQYFAAISYFAAGKINFPQSLTHLAFSYNPIDVINDADIYESNWDNIHKCPNLNTIMFLNNQVFDDSAAVVYIDLKLPESVVNIIVGINNPKCNLEFINDSGSLQLLKTYTIVFTEYVSAEHKLKLKLKFPNSNFETKSFGILMEKFI